VGQRTPKLDGLCQWTVNEDETEGESYKASTKIS